MRAVLDPNVLIAALLSPHGTPATLIVRWLAGDYELAVSEQLLDELGRVLAYPKIRARISEEDATEFIERVRANAELIDDRPTPHARSADPSDDYLLALAEAAHALLVSGDKHLLDLADAFPILTPARVRRHARVRALIRPGATLESGSADTESGSGGSSKLSNLVQRANQVRGLG